MRQVRIIPELRYRVETQQGEHVGYFDKADEWQGFVRLVAPNGEALIVESMFWTEDVIGTKRIAMVVKASPSILVKLGEQKRVAP